jgi:hypothetical protein
MDDDVRAVASRRVLICGRRGSRLARGESGQFKFSQPKPYRPRSRPAPPRAPFRPPAEADQSGAVNWSTNICRLFSRPGDMATPAKPSRESGIAGDMTLDSNAQLRNYPLCRTELETESDVGAE